MMLTQDLIYAARSLRKAPGLVAVVVLTLALGIGGKGAPEVAVVNETFARLNLTPLFTSAALILPPPET